MISLKGTSLLGRNIDQHKSARQLIANGIQDFPVLTKIVFPMDELSRTNASDEDVNKLNHPFRFLASYKYS